MTSKSATSPALLNVLVAVKEQGRTTAKQINVNAVYLLRLQDQELVRVVGKVHTGGRGRPAHIFACTDKGRKRAQRAMVTA